MQLPISDDGRDAGEVLLDVQDDLHGLSDVLLAFRSSGIEVEPCTIGLLRRVLAMTSSDLDLVTQTLRPHS